MAPTPVDVQPSNPQATSTPSKSSGIGTASIVAICIFAILALAFIVSITAYYFHKRSERNKLPPEKRPVSYHPFRTESYKAKEGLLANAAPSPEEDKSSMFSRDRGSSLSLYVDTDMNNRRSSMETVSLIPLHVTPAEEVHDPMGGDGLNSVGSGVSGRSGASRYSRGSLTPIDDGEQDLGTRKTRPRSTSAASARYYEVTPTDPTAPQLPIPKIVHTPVE